MIENYTNNKKVFHFFTKTNKLNLKQNIFTVIVGKNGTGKSTLLGNMIYDLINDKGKKYYDNSELGYKKFTKGEVKCIQKPARIIAVSTSPFDKFPLGMMRSEIDNYDYLGLRDLNSYNFSVSYMSKIISSLISSVNKRTTQANDISQVLKYLEYRDSIEIYFDDHRTRRNITFILDKIKRNKENEIQNSMYPINTLNRMFFLDKEGKIDEKKRKKFLTLIEKYISFKKDAKYKIQINAKGINFNKNPLDKSDLLFLIQSGVMRLSDVLLTPIKYGKKFSIKDASSGEQSVILSILGIASKIKDRSLICIDEPEVCLHPEWQAKYIQILISTFKLFKACHFIIATHSPQIISSLDDKNCFILSLESRKVFPADNFVNNSADYQLANIFNYPGFKNEYLSRISLNIFLKVSKNKYFDNTDKENYNILLQQSNFLSKSDPIYDLFNAIKEMYEQYV